MSKTTREKADERGWSTIQIKADERRQLDEGHLKFIQKAKVMIRDVPLNKFFSLVMRVGISHIDEVVALYKKDN